MRVDDNITVTSGSNFITVYIQVTTQLWSQIRQQVKGNRTFRNSNKTKLLVYFKDRVISLVTTNLELTIVVSDSSPDFTVIRFSDLFGFIWHTAILRQCTVVSTRTDILHRVTARSDHRTKEERSSSRSTYSTIKTKVLTTVTRVRTANRHIPSRTISSCRQNRINNTIQLNKHVGSWAGSRTVPRCISRRLINSKGNVTVAGSGRQSCSKDSSRRTTISN